MFMRSRIWALFAPALLIALVASLAAGVQRYASPAGGLQLPVPNTGDKALVVHTGSLQYPREAVDSDRFTVHIARPVHRIVSQSWSIDEWVYSVVPPQDVVAVSESAYKQRASNVYATVLQFHPAIASDPERVIALDPDLMIVSSNGRADYTSLARSSGVPVFRMQTMLQTLDQVEDAVRLVGYITGNEEAAAHEIARFHATVQKARSLRAENAPKPRILGLGGNYTYGKATLFDDIVGFLGGVNIASEKGIDGYEPVDFEQIVRWNPEWIIVGADDGKAETVKSQLLADPAISITQAAHDNHIVVLDNRIFLAKSPYASLLVQAIAEALYALPANSAREAP
jgi:ABC-type Fe3+-hydroxamate transport system substrate-binding protein